MGAKGHSGQTHTPIFTSSLLSQVQISGDVPASGVFASTGLSVEQSLQVIGAQPGMIVQVIDSPVPRYGVPHAYFLISSPDEKITMMRTVTSTDLRNESFHVDKAMQGKGIGLTVFAQQVDAAARAGLTSIKTTAIRDDTHNGYSTWAKFGYDADLNVHWAAQNH
jgi:GNAT superfamily N-acetyltransferase